MWRHKALNMEASMVVSLQKKKNKKKKNKSYYVVSASKASSVTLQWPGNESQKKHTAFLRISDRQSIQRLI